MVKYPRIIVFTFTAFILACSPKVKVNNSVATLVPAAEQKLIPVDSNVIIGQLPNGLTYYIRKNEEPKKRAELYLVNKVGSIVEDDDQQGLAHFTEHMAFNGTKEFPKNELIDYLQKAGVRFGADLNAYTGFDQTVYQLPLPTDSTELFKKGFDILANWAGYVSFDDHEIDQERGVIVEEDRQRGKNAQERMLKQLLPVLLANSRYAERLPIGKIDIIQNFKYETIKRFYRDWYRPNLQAVVAVGDFDVKEVEQLIKDNFSEFKNPESERKREEYTLGGNKEPLVKIVTDAEYPYNVASISYKHPERIEKTEEDLMVKVEESLINEMLNNRLNEILQKGNAPFVFAQSSYGPYQGGLANSEAFTSFVVAKDGKGLKQAVEAVLDENARMKKFGFTETELSRAKTNLMTTIEKRYKEREKTASSVYVQDYVEHFLKGQAIPSIDFIYAFYQKNLEQIKLGNVNALAGGMITEENMLAVIQAPDKEKANLPSDAEYLNWIKSAGKNVTAYVDEVIDQPLLTATPIAGKIVKEQKVAELDVTEFELSNGIKVVLKPTDFKNDQILFTASRKGGVSLATDQVFRAAEMADELVDESGIASFDAVQLGKLLTGKTLQVTPFIGTYSEGVKGSTSPKDLETAMQMIYLYFTQPRKDANVFQTKIDENKTVLVNRETNPSSVYQDTISAVLNNYHKRARVITIPELEKINLDDAFSFYKSRFSNANGFIFTFVGNFNVEEMKPLLETYLGSLPSNQQVASNYKDLGFYPVKGKVTKKVYKGLEDKASVLLIYHGDYGYSKEENMQLTALKSVLDFKILERLREKESGVYSPRVNVSYSNIPKATYSVSISFSCSTANVDKLIAAAEDEVAILKKNGATADDITKFKATQNRQYELMLRENGYWLQYLQKSVEDKKNLLDVLSFPDRLKEVNAGTVKQSANKYLDSNNFKQFILLPEKK
ncbi:M16 family metallopeptidase [Pseudopedobacter beijingensis]|uniref:M16 family metallopeptidase n=1 Tax=Pseudopedobacter beijingensis TaxID=1207056 RepID=A0ABW4I8X7_9SPHI